jgi:uracil-DNA glycosylase family 4
LGAQDFHLDSLLQINEEIVACRKCPRLVRYREAVAREKRRAFLDWEYWGKPVPGFGDPNAHLLILGLAPAAHGANRTGRMFTGDRSGDFLYRAMYDAGFATQPTSLHIGDGLALKDAYISATARCAPPANKPLPAELANCQPYLVRELEVLRPKVILVLGGIALRSYLEVLKQQQHITSFAAFPFGHGAIYRLPDPLPRLVASYHPSQQNTFTGKLTERMFLNIFRDIRRYLDQCE